MTHISDANPIVVIVSLIMQMFFLGIGGYYFCISLFSWFNKKEPAFVCNKTHTYALLVAAHNEEKVIGHMVKSLMQLNYDKSAYDVYVIADNCTDNTAKVAAQAGAIVFERTNEELRGKGHALEWMFANLFEMEEKGEKRYDSIAVFDADNLVDAQFLIEMNKRQNQGFKIVQGYIDSKNPFDSWITSAYTISFWSINKLYQTSRYNLNLPCQLCGTGFVIDTQVLKEIGWHATCLTEDMEFTMRLVLNNKSVSWAYNAVVYDEKPLTLTQSWRQRTRWMQGHADVASRFVLPLVKKAVKEKKWAPIDCVLYLLQPVRVITMGLITLMAWIQNMYPNGNLGFVQLWYLFDDPLVWNTYVLLQFLYLPMVVHLDRHKFSRKLFIGYFTYIVYSFTWIPITVAGVINKNKKEWFHTQHTREIAIEDFEKSL